MGHYKSNLRDIEFNLFEVLRRQDVLGAGPFATSTRTRPAGSSRGQPAGHRARSPSRSPRPTATRRSSTRRPHGGHARGFKRSYKAFMDAEWYRLELPAELGGTGAPRSLNWAVAELILGANPAVWMYASGARFPAAAVGDGHAGAAAVRRSRRSSASGPRPWC